jgi:transposase
MCARPIGMDLMEYYRLLKKIMTYGESGEDGLYRKQIIDERVSGLFTDKEIWERYGMSESTFYDLINRYSKEKEESLKDKTSTPINPSHKLGDEEIEIIIKKALDEKERIRILQSNYEENMKKDGRSLSLKKLERIKKSMTRAKI